MAEGEPRRTAHQSFDLPPSLTHAEDATIGRTDASQPHHRLCVVGRDKWSGERERGREGGRGQKIEAVRSSPPERAGGIGERPIGLSMADALMLNDRRDAEAST